MIMNCIFQTKTVDKNRYLKSRRSVWSRCKYPSCHDEITIPYNFLNKLTAHVPIEEILPKYTKLSSTRFLHHFYYTERINYFFFFHVLADPTDWNPWKHDHISKWSDRVGLWSIQTRWIRNWTKIRWNIRKEEIVSRKRRSDSPVSAVWTLTCSLLYLKFFWSNLVNFEEGFLNESPCNVDTIPALCRNIPHVFVDLSLCSDSKYFNWSQFHRTSGIWPLK